MEKSNKTRPYAWVPSLYFAEGLPYVVVMSVSVILYKRLGVSNTDLALYTGWLYLPWVIKPLWSPLVDLLKTKRWWIVTMQLVLGAALALIGLSLQLPSFVFYTLLFFWLMAFTSATHDIAADGFYMLGLHEVQQAKYVGIRSLFYRLAMVAAQGLLVVLAGKLEIVTGNVKFAWSFVFIVMAAFFALTAVYHYFLLPKPPSDVSANKGVDFWMGFGETFTSFFSKPNVGVAIAFFLLFRLGESQLAKMASPFLLDGIEAGGLGLSTTQVGLVYGTVGLACLITGGILGGFAIATHGLKHWIWWMALAMNLPDILYIWMANKQPADLWQISVMVGLEQFGYGFGFTAFLMYMMWFAEGLNKTSHYALATGFMALGMMLPGMVSGWLQTIMGYQLFFIWVTVCTIPGFILIKHLNIDASFGKRQST